MLKVLVTLLLALVADCGGKPTLNVPLYATGEEGVFPEFEEFRIDLPIQSGDWTIWPDKPQTTVQYRIGHPLEFAPFRWDFIGLSSESTRITLQPHYDMSTWDSFYVDTGGAVRVTAYGGLFRITLGEQRRLLEGVICTLRSLVKVIEVDHPELAGDVQKIIVGLEEKAAGMPLEMWPPDFGSLNDWSGISGAVSRRFWQWKLGKEPKGPLKCDELGPRPLF